MVSSDSLSASFAIRKAKFLLSPVWSTGYGILIQANFERLIMSLMIRLFNIRATKRKLLLLFEILHLRVQNLVLGT